MKDNNASIPKILRIAEVCQRLGGVSRSWLYDKLNSKSPRHDPSFPQFFRLGLRTVGILEEDLNLWIQSRHQNDRG